VVTFMTTEHFVLQTARPGIAELNGRAEFYLAPVSSGLIALAFTGQLSGWAPLSPCLAWCWCPRSPSPASPPSNAPCATGSKMSGSPEGSTGSARIGLAV